MEFLQSIWEQYDSLIIAIVIALAIVALAPATNTKRKKNEKYSVIVSEVSGEDGEIHRAPESKELVESIEGQPEVKTLYHNFSRAVKLYPERQCLGTRPSDGNGKVGDYTWQTYAEVEERARNFGCGLMKLNLIPSTDGMRLLGMFSKNREEWLVGEQGLFFFGGTTVPLYDTLGPETIEYIIDQTKLSTVLCAQSETSKVLDAKAKCKSLKAVVQMEPAAPADVTAAQKKGVQLLGFAEVEELGRNNPRAAEPPAPDRVATFCYTSGTTGMPKGVRLTHLSMVSMLAGCKLRGVCTTPEDVHLSYLPLAHVFERIVVSMLLNEGGAVGFYQGDTLKIMSDLSALRPTVFPSVPRLLNKVYDKIMAGATASPVKAALFKAGLAAKKARMEATGDLTHWLWDKLVFGKVSKKVGLERCRLIITGSAPISAEVMLFLRLVFGTTVVEGYGQSETAAASTITAPSDMTCGHVGAPTASVECKLVSVPDMGYNVTDERHSAGEGNDIPCRGRGEICFRGPSVFKDYYKEDAKTKETLDKDGWCHTGDIGIWLPDGQLRIVDRKKNMFKLSQGEYVAAEKIENVYATCEMVAQCFLYGDSLQSCLVAIVHPDPDFLKKWADANGKGSMDFKDLCADKAATAAVLDQMTKVGRAAKLKGFELAKMVWLEPEQFSVENGLLTPTFKLKRHEAKLAYKKQIDAMYAALLAKEKAANGK